MSEAVKKGPGRPRSQEPVAQRKSRPNVAFEVTVEGSYYKIHDRGKTIGRFDNVKLRIPMNARGPGRDGKGRHPITRETALWFVRNRMIDIWIQKNLDAECSHHRECRIVNLKDCRPKDTVRKQTAGVRIEDMSLDELQGVVNKYEFNIELENFGSVVEARKKIRELVDERQLKQKREKEEKKEKDVDKSLAELNDLPGIEAMPYESDEE